MELNEFRKRSQMRVKMFRKPKTSRFCISKKVKRNKAEVQFHSVRRLKCIKAALRYRKIYKIKQVSKRFSGAQLKSDSHCSMVPLTN